MDARELDEWLGTTEEEAAREPESWRPPSARETHPAPDEKDAARGRWVRIAVLGGGVWVLVMVVLALGGGDSDASGEAAPAPFGPTAPPGSGPASQDAGADVVAEAATAGPTPSEAPTPDADMSSPTSDPGDEGSSPEVSIPAVEAAAVLGLRMALSERSALNDQIHYLEWALPVGRRPLADGVELLLLDAVWLIGTDEGYDRAARGRWAIPVADDGRVLSRPWLVGRTDTPPLPAPEPPAIRQRVGEVEEALQAAGWQDVVVHGSEAHPELAGVWVAVIDGTDPVGSSAVGALVWLEDGQFLQLLGSVT